MAGWRGIRGELQYGEADDFCYNVVKDGVDVHGLNAMLLNQLGVDHTRLGYHFQGRAYRLTDVAGKVVRGILA